MPPPVRVITRIARVSAVAASTSARRAASESVRACAAKTVSRLSPTGTGCGSGSAPCSCSPVSRRGSSSSASGFPPVAATSSSATSGEIAHVRIVIEQDGGGLRVEPSELELGNPLRAKAPAAGCEEHDDAFRLEPPRRERERAGRGLVEPVRVVDHAEERSVVPGGREQAQCRGADVQPAGALRLGERERAAQRVRLHRRQLRQPVEQRADELVQARVRELRLRLDAERPYNPRGAGASNCVLEQGALADPGLAADDERAAPAALRLIEHPIDPSALALTADEHTPIIERDVFHTRARLGKSRTRPRRLLPTLGSQPYE